MKNMTNQTETRERVRVGRTEMDFSHEGKILTAVHPFYGHANSKTLLENIRQDGFREPTAPEVASFVHEYFNGNEPQAQEVQEIMKSRYLRGFTEILYVPEDNGEGLAHFIDGDLEFNENSYVITRDLQSRIEEARESVSFEHLRQGSVPWREVAKNPYFVAWAGEEGAEKIAELASKHSKREAYIWVPNVSELKEPTTKIASLVSDWEGDGLLVGSYELGVDADAHAFGVLDSAEGTRAKNE